tara:strand:- start:70 stop:375 length:306 start_codon:yes stop_codon:yes gene_type:complete
MNILSLNKKITLFVFSFIGLVVVNSMYLYWQFFQFEFATFFNNTIAVALFIEVFLLTILLSIYFKFNPIGKIKWYWLIIFSLLGSLLFALPFYYWLNTRKS